MRTRWKCPCGHKLWANVALVGELRRCSKCGRIQVVPAPARAVPLPAAPLPAPAPKRQGLTFLVVAALVLFLGGLAFGWMMQLPDDVAGPVADAPPAAPPAPLTGAALKPPPAPVKPPPQPEPPAAKPPPKPNPPAKPAPKPPPEPPRARPDPAALKTAVALVSGKHGRGTGFLIAPGVLATSASVLANELLDDVAVRFVGDDLEGPRLKARLLHADKHRDLALLEVASDRKPLELGAAPAAGDAVSAVGHALGKAGTRLHVMPRGRFAETVLVNDRACYQMELAVAAGMEGGPVLDAGGRVVGVLSWRPDEGAAVGLCAPAAALRRALADAADADRELRVKTARARHHLEVLYLRLTVGGGLAADTLQAPADDGDGAIPARADVWADCLAVQKALFADTRPIFTEVLNSPLLPPTVIERMHRYREYCNRMLGLLQHPPARPRDLAGQSANARRWFRYFGERLREEINLPESFTIRLALRLR